MPYSPEQNAKILSDYWERGRVTCPACQALLKPHFHAGDSGEYLLIGNCPRGCGEFHLDRSKDALASTFRPWTDAEKKRMVDARVEGREVHCPVDGSAVKVIEHPTDTGRPVIMAQCHRCGSTLPPTMPS